MEGGRGTGYFNCCTVQKSQMILENEQQTNKSSEAVRTNQPQRFAGRNLNREEELVVGHIQNDLILRNQDVTAAVSVRTEGGVGVT